MAKIILIAFALCANSLTAIEVPQHYTPVRPNALGGAFTAIANDENAIWTNPAGISRVRKARSRKTTNIVSFPNAVAGANADGTVAALAALAAAAVLQLLQ